NNRCLLPELPVDPVPRRLDIGNGLDDRVPHQPRWIRPEIEPADLFDIGSIGRPEHRSRTVRAAGRPGPGREIQDQGQVPHAPEYGARARAVSGLFRAHLPCAAVPDVVIIGGAANGWATAYHLLRLDPSLEVTVVERDPTLRHSSTMLSDGNVRIQFNLEENIRISQYAMEVLEEFPETMTVGEFQPDPKLRKQGNLFLVDDDTKQAALAGLANQQRLGCDSVWLDMDEVADRWPALTSGTLVGGTFGPSDGSVDPAAVVEGYRRKALEMGAEAVVGEVTALIASGDLITGVRLADGKTLGA